MCNRLACGRYLSREVDRQTEQGTGSLRQTFRDVGMRTCRRRPDRNDGIDTEGQRDDEATRAVWLDRLRIVKRPSSRGDREKGRGSVHRRVRQQANAWLTQCGVICLARRRCPTTRTPTAATSSRSAPFDRPADCFKTTRFGGS